MNPYRCLKEPFQAHSNYYISGGAPIPKRETQLCPQVGGRDSCLMEEPLLTQCVNPRLKAGCNPHPRDLQPDGGLQPVPENSLAIKLR